MENNEYIAHDYAKDHETVEKFLRENVPHVNKYSDKDFQKMLALNDEAHKAYFTMETKGAFWESTNDIGVNSNINRTLGNDIQLLALYTNNSVVHACISKNANEVAATENGLFTNSESSSKVTKANKTKRRLQLATARMAKRFKKSIDQLSEITNHPLLDLLDNEDEDLDHTDFVRLTATYVQIFGKAYWLMNHTGDDAPTSLSMLKPYYVTPQRDLEGQVIGYYYTNVYSGTTGSAGFQQLRYEKTPLRKEDVIDFRFPAPSDPYAGGDSPLRAAFEKVALSNKFTEWQNYVLNNRARIDGMLIVKSPAGVDVPVDIEKLKAVESRFNQKFKGDGNGGTLATDLATIDYKPVSYGPTDIAPLKIDEEVKKALCNALHIPIALMEDNPNRAGIQGSLQQWARQGVMPLISLIERKINRYLLPLFTDDSNIFYAFENPVPEDQEFELAQQVAEDTRWATAITAQAVTINEIRARLGLDDIDGGDELPAAPAPTDPQGDNPDDTDPTDGPDSPGDGQYDPEASETPQKALGSLLRLNKAVAAGRIPRAVAINMVAKTLNIEQEEAKGYVGFPTEKTLKTCSCGNCEDRRLTDESTGTIAEEKTLKSAAKDRLKTEAKAYKKIKGAVARYFGGLKSEALANIKNHKKSAAGDLTGDLGKLFQKADTGRIPSEFTSLETWANELKNTPDDLAYAVKPLVEISAREAADGSIDALVRAGASPDAFSVVPQKLATAVEKRSINLAQSTLDTTSDTVANAIARLKQEIEDGVEEGDPVDALTDRVSEIFDNATEAQAERIARTESAWSVHAGQVTAAKESGIVKNFQILTSGETCDICQEAANEMLSMKAASESVDSGDVEEDTIPPLHPNCRCTLLENVEIPDDDDDSN